MMMRTPNETYVAKGGMCCPFCQSREVSAGRLEVDGTTITQEVECAVCQRDWADVYTLTGYQVEGESETPADSVASDTPAADLPGWHPCSISFARHEGANVTTTAYVELLTLDPLSDEDALASLIDAVTVWVAETDEGKESWLGSGEDINIGDLLGEGRFSDPGLVARMERRGLRFVCGDSADADHRFPFDTVLADRDRLLLDADFPTAVFSV